MKRVLVVIGLLLFSFTAQAFQPRTGHWYNPTEPGSGYNIDIQDGILIVTIFTYKATGGDSEWYLASGPLTNGNRTFAGTLDKYRNGQCISCAYAAPAIIGNDGTITIDFSSETSATLTLPGGRTTTIRPFNFGFGDPPDGLLGEWVFVYDILITFADRYDFTTIAAGTSSGNGLAVDPTRAAGCELQVAGDFAGTVLCARVDAGGNLLSGYQFNFGLDETYAGTYVARSGNEYAMKGFRIKGKGGQAKTSTVDGDPLASEKAVQDALAGKAHRTTGKALALALQALGASIHRATQGVR